MEILLKILSGFCPKKSKSCFSDISYPLKLNSIGTNVLVCILDSRLLVDLTLPNEIHK